MIVTLSKQKSRVAELFVFVISCFLLLVTLFPYAYLVLSSLKPPREVISTNPSLLPSVFTLANYNALFHQLNIGKYFINSLITAMSGTLLSVFLGSLAAYGLTRFASKLGNIFLLFTLGCV